MIHKLKKLRASHSGESNRKQRCKEVQRVSRVCAPTHAVEKQGKLDM